MDVSISHARLYGKEIYSLFLREQEAVSLGVRYLTILAISQFFLYVQITTGGVFNGIGKSIPPSPVGITMTGLLIPIALYLSQPQFFGVTGVWWRITLTSAAKGVILFRWFYIRMRSHPHYTVLPGRKIEFIRLMPTIADQVEARCH